MVRDEDPERVKHRRGLLASERDAAVLYSRIAETETGERRAIFEELASVERRHAAHAHARRNWAWIQTSSDRRCPPPSRAC